MRADIRKQVFDAKDIPEEVVSLPKAWGGAQVLVRGLTAGELTDWASGFSGKPTKQQSAELIILSVRDPETGEQVFDRADRDELIGKGAKPFAELLAHCYRLSGLVKGGDDLKADG